MDNGQLLLTQAERDRLTALKKAQEKLITQKQAAEEIGVTERQARRLLVKLRRMGDGAVIHALPGRPSNQRFLAATGEQAVRSFPGLSEPGLRSNAGGGVSAQATQTDGQ